MTKKTLQASERRISIFTWEKSLFQNIIFVLKKGGWLLYSCSRQQILDLKSSVPCQAMLPIDINKPRQGFCVEFLKLNKFASFISNNFRSKLVQLVETPRDCGL